MLHKMHFYAPIFMLHNLCSTKCQTNINVFKVHLKGTLLIAVVSLLSICKT